MKKRDIARVEISNMESGRVSAGVGFRSRSTNCDGLDFSFNVSTSFGSGYSLAEVTFQNPTRGLKKTIQMPTEISKVGSMKRSLFNLFLGEERYGESLGDSFSRLKCIFRGTIHYMDETYSQGSHTLLCSCNSLSRASSQIMIDVREKKTLTIERVAQILGDVISPVSLRVSRETTSRRVERNIQRTFSLSNFLGFVRRHFRVHVIVDFDLIIILDEKTKGREIIISRDSGLIGSPLLQSWETYVVNTAPRLDVALKDRVVVKTLTGEPKGGSTGVGEERSTCPSEVDIIGEVIGLEHSFDSRRGARSSFVVAANDTFGMYGPFVY